MKQSLCGLRILNTRPQGQAQQLSQEITAAGGVAIECPALELAASDTDWLDSLPDLNQVHHAIFVSPNAVHYALSQLEQNNIRWLGQINTIAIGKGTAKALNSFQIQANDIPEMPDSEHLLALETLEQLKNQTVLLFKGEGGRTLIEESLRARGAELFSLVVYQRKMPVIQPQLIYSLWHDDAVDIILFTSEQSMRNLFKMFDRESHNWLRHKPCLVISERLAREASLLGMKKIIISHPDRMISTLFDYKD
ncbi:uroporphyrinogen-III synthase [Legionella shakespearei]|uniref:Uroporphyrinogen-III synthase n=1 Tax=Legionella shakespearei DSM 23087 TaxID=1122169 RepID=A0A0W0YSY2_9GAMM|nr:uroporphyrinogen-III synthase [Legionella shakespearei]KTD59940.1 uroporphyrinogen-III synthase [Legionella shakespearei DSM 23087]